MDNLSLILVLSTVMWYVIDRAKKEFWEELSFGRWLTVGCAAVLGFCLTFSFNLDLVYALGFVDSATIAGKLLTGLILMSGSSAVSEIIEGVNKNKY